MEIVKKAVVSFNGKSEEVDAAVDTGAEQTMIDDEVLLKIGAVRAGDVGVISAGEYREKKPVYGAMVEIDGYRFPLWVTGGRKNLIGHDFLQKAKAVIDESTGDVRLTKNFVEM